MKLLFLILFTVGFQFTVFGKWTNSSDTTQIIQKNKEENQKNSIIVKQPPEPNGGMAGLYKFISKKLKYPKEARKNGIEGKVFVEFVVDEQGTIPEEYIKVVKGVHPSLDSEALRVISKMPKWSPGFDKEGNPVKLRMIIPVAFKL